MRIPAHPLKCLAMASFALMASSGLPGVLAAEKSTAPQLIELAKSASPALRDAIISSFEAKDLKEGTAWAGRQCPSTITASWA